MLVAFEESLCSVVFSALTESSGGLQVIATRVLTALGQQPGECRHKDLILLFSMKVTFIMLQTISISCEISIHL